MEEQRLPATFIYLTNDPLPEQGSEKLSEVEFAGTPDCQIPPLHPYVHSLTSQL